ncbi:MAG TPA: FlgO family outer membrane protein [Vicinamibacterales bacterium]|nr:FlgO family outer membrane protein [Vicinamibacterales bacterium]
MTARLLRIVFLSCLTVHVAASSAFAQKILSEGIRELATQIAASAAKEQKKRIAVVTFRELDGRTTVLGAFLAEELVTNLFSSGGLQIVERSMLDKVMGELKLGGSGAIDPETAKHVGKLTGVDALVTGSITDLQSYVAINCRMIDVQTGAVFAAAQTRIVKDDDLRKIMGAMLDPSGSSAAPVSPAPGTPAASAAQPPPAAPATFRTVVGGLQIELTSCRHSFAPPAEPEADPRGPATTQNVFGGTQRRAGGSDVVCTSRLTADRDRQVQVNIRNSRAIDTNGAEYNGTEGRLGSRSDTYSLYHQLISGVPIALTLKFSDVAADVTSFAVVELSIYADREATAQFRNVPVGR